MSKTTRQTDKATWWSVTAFGDEISLLQDNTKWPPEVKTVYGGVEECPDTGRKHFQGAIQLHKQQRLSWFKSWLPTSHMEVARSKEALVKYAMKEDTAVGDKLVTENSIKYMDARQICMLLISSIYDDYRNLLDKEKDDKDYMYWEAVHRILLKDPAMAGQLMNPTLKGWFRNTRFTWYQIFKKELEDSAEVDDDSVISHA